ncbi:MULTISPECIES: NAD-dependent epimerase/dehydratase family protein [Thermodesulfovibrio]|uniref:NAD-dependent epimerase/dehydratase family protein n=1 Tax=Thermodesulfovibrio yellowstonii TaxID=28262 RepID=UPI0004170BEA|nr:NAD-dependent epimerase/dehydratase family protein [Thermodesulfovibrio islandicus]
MYSVLITGATGYIGSKLVSHLLNLGYKVSIIARTSSQHEILSRNDINILRFEGDVEILKEFISDIKPNVVFHIASLFVAEHSSNQIPDLVNSNILFPTLLTEAMIKSKVYNLVNIGTSWQHFKYDSLDYIPVNLYSATKQAFIDILKYYIDAEGLKVITLKLFDTYGPNDSRRKLLNLLKESHINGVEIDMSAGEQMIDLVYIDDVINAIEFAGKRLMEISEISYEEYSVDTRDPIKVKDLVVLYEKISGAKLNIKFGKKPYRKREVFIPWQMGKWLPGWKPKVSLEEGLKKFIQSYKRFLEKKNIEYC